jgi:hypothetical protein
LEPTPRGCPVNFFVSKIRTLELTLENTLTRETYIVTKNTKSSGSRNFGLLAERSKETEEEQRVFNPYKEKVRKST